MRPSSARGRCEKTQGSGVQSLSASQASFHFQMCRSWFYCHISIMRCYWITDSCSMCTVCVKNAKLSQPFEFDMWYNELIYDRYINDIWCVVMFCSLCTLRAIAGRFALLAVWLAIVRPIAACQLPKAWLHYPQVIGQHQGGTRQSAASFAEPLARQALRCRLDCRQRGTLWSHGQQGSGTSQKAWFVGYALQSGTENLLHIDSDKTFSDQAWTDDMTNPTLTNCEVIDHWTLATARSSQLRDGCLSAPLLTLWVWRSFCNLIQLAFIHFLYLGALTRSWWISFAMWTRSHLNLCSLAIVVQY